MAASTKITWCGKSRFFINVQSHSATRTLCKSTGHGQSDSPKTFTKSYDEMPHVPMIPFFGSSWAYLPVIGKYNKGKLHKADLQKHSQYGNVVRERFGKVEIVTSYLPDTMRVLAENEGLYPSRSDFSTLKEYRQKRKVWFEPDGFLVAQGKEWDDIRQALEQYLCQRPFLQNYLEHLKEIGKDFVELMSCKIDSKGEIGDALPHLRKWALESVARVILDTRLGCLAANIDAEADCMKILNAVETQLSCMYKLEAASGSFPLWKYFPTPTWLKFKNATDVFTALSYQYITRAIYDTSSSFRENVGESDSFLQHMLLSEKLKLQHVVVILADIILAGLGTTSHTAAFLLYNLAKNPEKQRLAYQEICRVLPEGDKITLEKYDQLKYLKACLKESLRLHPTVRGHARVLDREISIDGFKVPAGVTIICVLQLMNQSEMYFKDAKSFVPERWDSNNEKINEFAYQPFGYGRRDCVGKDLAEMEIVMLLAQVLRKYFVEYHYQDIDMYTRLINVPDKPLKLKFVERERLIYKSPPPVEC